MKNATIFSIKLSFVVLNLMFSVSDWYVELTANWRPPSPLLSLHQTKYYKCFLTIEISYSVH